MKHLQQFLIILGFSALGELCHWLIPWPIPASIYGMALLFLALSLKLVKVEQVKQTGGFLVSIMPVLFVVPLVSLMENWDLISRNLVAIVSITVVSTVTTFAGAGLVTQWLAGRGKERKHD